METTVGVSRSSGTVAEGDLAPLPQQSVQDHSLQTKFDFRFQRTLTILTGLAQQGGIDASPGHEIRRQWTAASLRQQTASALGRHCAASNTATSVIDVNRSRANAHPVSQHHGITTSAVPEDVARPDVVPYAPSSPQERWHGGQVKAHMSASRRP